MPVDASEVHVLTVAQSLALTHAFHDENGRADLRLLVQRLNGTVVTGRPQLTVGDDGTFTISTLRGFRYETAHLVRGPGRGAPGFSRGEVEPPVPRLSAGQTSR